MKKVIAYAVQWPDGIIYPRHMYDSKRDLEYFAPGDILGGLETWRHLKSLGFKCIKVEISAV